MIIKMVSTVTNRIIRRFGYDWIGYFRGLEMLFFPCKFTVKSSLKFPKITSQILPLRNLLGVVGKSYIAL